MISKETLEEIRNVKSKLVYISDGTRAGDRLLNVLKNHDLMLRELEDIYDRTQDLD